MGPYPGTPLYKYKYKRYIAPPKMGISPRMTERKYKGHRPGGMVVTTQEEGFPLHKAANFTFDTQEQTPMSSYAQGLFCGKTQDYQHDVARSGFSGRTLAQTKQHNANFVNFLASAAEDSYSAAILASEIGKYNGLTRIRQNIYVMNEQALRLEEMSDDQCAVGTANSAEFHSIVIVSITDWQQYVKEYKEEVDQYQR